MLQGMMEGDLCGMVGSMFDRADRYGKGKFSYVSICILWYGSILYKFSRNLWFYGAILKEL